MDFKTAVCLPTYNEAENITPVAEAVLQILPQAFIVIIDDNSPDGTGKIADELAHKDPRIFVLHRPKKQGLGKAYCEGFAFALEQLGADLIVQMDSDLSHNPENLPQMICAAENADLVIGSRYVSGGRTENWNRIRRMISRFGAFYARSILGLPVHDPTGGFKLWNRNMLKRVLNHPISSGGYVFQVETTFCAYCMEAKIREIPICFVDRGLGRSKMTASIALEAFWRIPAMTVRKKVFK